MKKVHHGRGLTGVEERVPSERGTDSIVAPGIARRLTNNGSCMDKGPPCQVDITTNPLKLIRGGSHHHGRGLREAVGKRGYTPTSSRRTVPGVP